MTATTPRRLPRITRARPCRSWRWGRACGRRRWGSGAHSRTWGLPSPSTSGSRRSRPARRSSRRYAGERGERRPGRAGPHGAAARLRALQRVPRRRRARGDGRPGIRGDERGERVVRSHDLRGADGAGRGGRGRGPQVHAHRGGDGGGPAGRALRRLPPAARRVRDGPRGDSRRPDRRAALDVGPAAPRRLHPRVPRPMRRAALTAALTAVAALTAATACTEDVTAPGHCPDFCPSGSISGVDTVLQTVVQRDSAFRGFVRPHEANTLLAATLPGVIDSRAIFRTLPIGDSLVVESSTGAMGAIVGVDSLKLALTITRRDTSAHNLTLVYYRLPLGIDSTTTFGGLGSWTDSLRSLNADSVYALAGHVDALGDSVFVDTTTHQMTVIAKLDSAMAPFVPADSGQVAFGVRVVADSRASIALGSVEAGLGPRITWFAEVDSLGKDTVP